jgi:EAL domain-containing protein (putative c-di-GMP-specific phosphodiesterase class I)
MVKIDGVFVRDVESDIVNKRMIESIIGIASAMNIQVVAECVETEEAKQLLKAMKADFIQGFGLHRPEHIDILSRTLE